MISGVSGSSGYSSYTRASTSSTTSVDSINDNTVSSATYVNLSGSLDLGKQMQIFASVNNLLNKDPPVAPGGNGYPTNPVYFDTYGTTWKLGMRLKL